MQHRLSNCLVCRRRSCHISEAHLGLICTLYLLARKASRCHTIQTPRLVTALTLVRSLDRCTASKARSSRPYLPELTSSVDPCAKARTPCRKFRHCLRSFNAPVFGHDALKIKFRSKHSKEMIIIKPQRSPNRQHAASGASATVIGTHPGIPQPTRLSPLAFRRA